MSEKLLFENRRLFVLYGALNVLLIAALLVLLVLILNEIYILGRIGFVIFVGIHLSLIFFIKVHYLRISYDEENQKIEFTYNKKFGLKWQINARTVILPLHQFDGYELNKDSLGIAFISFYKLEKKERYELGPLSVGIISRRQRSALNEAFGDSL